MSKAAIAPIQPYISKEDIEHPLFPMYKIHRSNMTAQLVEVESFRDWLFHFEENLRILNEIENPRYPEFLEWMRSTKGGSRKCPVGNTFPINFHFWLEGGRW